MKKFATIAFLFLTVFTASAQELTVARNTKGLYLAHTVGAKENFYSLGRLYNVPPKDIAAFNGLQMEGGLSIGQTVNIPLSAANFSQQDSKGQPVYYVVGEKEGLYRVSVNNNKVLMANLRKWNNLATDAVSVGQKLIVGYLQSSGAPATVAQTPPVEKKEEIVARQPEAKPEPVVNESQPERRETVVEKKPEPQRTGSAVLNDASGGYFKSAFEMQSKAAPASKEETATAGIFKTASGWQDAKYYALIDGVEPGTIIRIVNPTNNKAIYAKVLDKMTGIRQNQGYNVRISNAAATALAVSDTDKFSVRVNY